MSVDSNDFVLIHKHTINENHIGMLEDENFLHFSDKEIESHYQLESHQFLSSCKRYVYHIALIDYLQVYYLNKMMERAFK